MVPIEPLEEGGDQDEKDTPSSPSTVISSPMEKIYIQKGFRNFQSDFRDEKIPLMVDQQIIHSINSSTLFRPLEIDQKLITPTIGGASRSSSFLSPFSKPENSSVISFPSSFSHHLSDKVDPSFSFEDHCGFSSLKQFNPSS
jgi:hypothetical protein